MEEKKLLQRELLGAATLIQFPQRQEKMVLSPHSKHRVTPLLVEGHRVLPIPFVNRHSKIELSHSEHWPTAAVTSLCPKPQSKTIPVAEVFNHQATSVPLSHLNQQTMSIASQCPKPGHRTIILHLPYPTHKTRKTDVSLSCPQCQLDPLSDNSHNEEPSVHNSLPEVQISFTYLPKIPQGCTHVSEGPLHHVWSVSPQCPDFQAEVPQCPDHKTMTTAAPLSFPKCQANATGVPLPRLSHQSEMSPSFKHRDKEATSKLLCLKLQPRIIVTVFPDLDHSHRDRAIPSSCSNHQTRTTMPSPCTETTRDITVLTNQGLNHFQMRATGGPLRGHKQKIRKMIISLGHDQQARVVSMLSSPLTKTSFTCSDLLAEISKWPIYKTQGTHIFLPPSDGQGKTPKVSYTSAKVSPVSNQRDTISKGSDQQADLLPKLSGCIATPKGPSHQHSETLKDVNDQTKSPSGSKHLVTMLSGPLHQSATSEHLASVLLHPNNWDLSQLGFQHQDKSSLNPVQGEKILSSFNCGLKALSVPKTRTIFSLNYNHFAEAMTDTDSQTRKEISSRCQTETSPNTNKKTEVELEHDYCSEIKQRPDIRTQISTCLDHFSEGSLETNLQTTFPSGPDHNIKVPLNLNCQVLPSPDPHHWAESAIINDHQTKILPDSDHQTRDAPDFAHCFEPELNLDNCTKSSLDLNHQILATLVHDKPMLDVLQNTRTQPKPSHKSKAASGLDHRCEPHLNLDHKEESSLNSKCQVKTAPELDKQSKAALGTVKKSLTQPSLPNQLKTISTLDHYCKLDLDLGHREKSLLNSNHQVKISLEYHKKPQTTKDIIPKSTSKLSPEHQASSTPDPDHNKEPAVLPNYHGPTLSVPGHQPNAPVGPDCLMEFSLRSKDRVDAVPIVLSSPDQTFAFPKVLEKESNYTVDPGKWATLQRWPDNLNKLPLGHDQEAKTPKNLHIQPLPQLFPRSDCTKTVSDPLSQDQKKKNGTSTWSFRYIEPYTTGRGNIFNEIVNNIIGSIPKEKIKNDIKKQILLRQIEKRLNSQPGPQLSCNYPVCLICATWVPHGCTHSNMIKGYGRTQLVAIPMPVPGSKEEMGIKFVLRVPERRLSSSYLRSHQYNVPYHSHFCPSALASLEPVPPGSPAYPHLPERLTRLWSSHGKHYRPNKKIKSVNQKPFERKMPTKSNNTIEVRPKTPKGVFSTVLEKVQSKRMH